MCDFLTKCNICGVWVWGDTLSYDNTWAIKTVVFPYCLTACSIKWIIEYPSFKKLVKLCPPQNLKLFFFPSFLFSPSFIFVGFSNIKLSPDFQTGWKIRVSPACEHIQRARSLDVPPCSVAVAVQEQDHSDMLMDQRGSSKRGLPRFKRQLPSPFLFMPYSQPASLFPTLHW